jgi:hypothetical protein
MMRKLFFQTTVFIFFAFCLVACRNELETINTFKNQDSNTINFSQFKNETKTTQFNDLIETHVIESLNKGNQNEDILHIFKIDTTSINRLDYKENHY